MVIREKYVRSPAKAGAHLSAVRVVEKWVPASAGKQIPVECSL